MLSQIGYFIYLSNMTNKTNIEYWFLIKYKQVAYNILTTELYRIAYGFDIEKVIKATLKRYLNLLLH